MTYFCPAAPQLRSGQAPVGKKAFFLECPFFAIRAISHIFLCHFWILPKPLFGPIARPTVHADGVMAQEYFVVNIRLLQANHAVWHNWLFYEKRFSKSNKKTWSYIPRFFFEMFYYTYFSTHVIISPTVLMLDASLSSMIIPNSSSSLIIRCTISMVSAPKSSMNLVSGVQTFSSIPNAWVITFFACSFNCFVSIVLVFCFLCCCLVVRLSVYVYLFIILITEKFILFRRIVVFQFFLEQGKDFSIKIL